MSKTSNPLISVLKLLGLNDEQIKSFMIDEYSPSKETVTSNELYTPEETIPVNLVNEENTSSDKSCNCISCQFNRLNIDLAHPPIQDWLGKEPTSTTDISAWIDDWRRNLLKSITTAVGAPSEKVSPTMQDIIDDAQYLTDAMGFSDSLLTQFHFLRSINDLKKANTKNERIQAYVSLHIAVNHIRMSLISEAMVRLVDNMETS